MNDDSIKLMSLLEELEDLITSSSKMPFSEKGIIDRFVTNTRLVFIQPHIFVAVYGYGGMSHFQGILLRLIVNGTARAVGEGDGARVVEGQRAKGQLALVGCLCLQRQRDGRADGSPI